MRELHRPLAPEADRRAVAIAAASDRAAAVLAAAAFLLGLYLYLGRLGASPLQAGTEAMYAAPPIHMLESGDYLVPRFHGKNFLDKPPLAVWLIAGSYKLFGVSEATARLPAALVSLTTVLVVGLWVRRRRGNRAAAISALLLLYMHSFWTSTRFSAADALLALTVTLSVMALDAACRRHDGRDVLWGALSGAALGLAFMSKGLVGVVLPVGAVATGLAVDHFRPAPLRRRVLAAAAMLFAIITPWHWAVAR
ncbi:MAG TPA: glycosyltransferase family 39 protein, partial [Thermoanaerobaculia bacterium]|nr:glycosyltransferase family 39 protein [Thermoanaerobaculia bacterium]